MTLGLFLCYALFELCVHCCKALGFYSMLTSLWPTVNLIYGSKKGICSKQGPIKPEMESSVEGLTLSSVKKINSNTSANSYFISFHSDVLYMFSKLNKH